MTNQGSENVVWSIIRRSNCKVRPYVSFNTRPFFTRESNNLVQRQVFKYSGFREQVVGVVRSTRTTKSGKKKKSIQKFGVVLSNPKKGHKPRTATSTAQIDLNGKGVTAAKHYIRTLTNARLYRPELAKAAVKRVMKSHTASVKAARVARKEKRLNKNKKKSGDKKTEKKKEDEKKPDQKGMELVD
ncbi:60S ribosomal protein L28 (RPL28C) [Reticulomyxa filosa]|uniref:60S ribosomal protein L28 (RPL28C) n=1 Tax=Reticulomyxa filosa TaxID=46433 RepID=X6MUQ0_RETFI|nr:60S ribosomal protein L28 (RPL28C) [Reticulomyxa filosa]|eukprot:ETO16830.1 60S ribosomal protein L28 (RPL28C) [Reticulomyxa filosa]